MISKVKVVPDLTQWHDWYAWRPVRIHAGKSRMYVWVWRVTIERKLKYWSEGCDKEYRFKSR